MSLWLVQELLVQELLVVQACTMSSMVFVRTHSRHFEKFFPSNFFSRVEVAQKDFMGGRHLPPQIFSRCNFLVHNRVCQPVVILDQYQLLVSKAFELFNVLPYDPEFRQKDIEDGEFPNFQAFLSQTSIILYSYEMLVIFEIRPRVLVIEFREVTVIQRLKDLEQLRNHPFMRIPRFL